MSKSIDISSKLCDEDKFLAVAKDKHYKVDDRKNTVMKVNALVQNSSEMEAMDEAIQLVLGKKAHKEIEAMNLTMSGYQAVFIGMMALIVGKTYDEMEQSFRNQTA